jgi:hypothetical protein
VTARERRAGEARRVANPVRICLADLLLLATCLPASGADLLDRVKQQESTRIIRPRPIFYPPFSKGGQGGGLYNRLIIPLNPPLEKADFKTAFKRPRQIICRTIYGT